MGRSAIRWTLVLLVSLIGCRQEPAPVVTRTGAAEYEETEAVVPLSLSTSTIEDGDGSNVSLSIPDGYRLSVAAKGMRRACFFARPDGRWFVTGLHSLADNERGRVDILGTASLETDRFPEPLGLAGSSTKPQQHRFFHGLHGRALLHLALTHELRRYPFQPGENRPSAEPEVLRSFPGEGLSYKYGGWHLTRTLPSFIKCLW